MATYNMKNTAIPDDERSYFDGGYFAYFGCLILVGFVTAITLGIAYPWMCCWFENWKAKHTVVCGKRMYFDGKGLQLIGKYLLWGFLTIITFGIYGFWMSIAMRKWIAKHTHYQGEADNNSYFDGGVLGLLGTNILSMLVSAVPVVGLAWSKIIKLRWETKHTVVDSRRHIFVGTIGSLFVKYLLWGFLTVITFGIYAWFMPVKVTRWETENKIDNEHTTQELIARGEYRANVHTDAASFNTFKVEDDMECVKAGITDAMGQEELLALANSGVRAAQYTYVVRYGQDQYTYEPFSSLLRAAAQAEYAPAMSLYLQTHAMDADTRIPMLQKAADKGQTWAIRTSMTAKAQEALALKENKDALPALKCAVRFADLLKESQIELTAEEEKLVQKCIFAIRRIQSAIPPSNSGKIIGIIVAVLIGVPVLIGVVVGAAKLVSRIPNNNDNNGYYEDYDGYQDYDGYDEDYLYGDSSMDAAVSPNKSKGLLGFIGSLFGGSKDGADSNFAGNAAANDLIGNVVDDAYDNDYISNDAIGGDAIGNGVIGGNEGQDVIVPSDPVVDGLVSTSEFWKRYTAALTEEYCVLTKTDEASNGTVKYEITCNQYYWNSLHYAEVLQNESGLQKLKLSGLRIYEPDSPDPTLNEAQWVYLVREAFRQLDLGTYDDITPYTADGVYTDTYNGWIFSYENTGSDVSVTITRG